MCSVTLKPTTIPPPPPNPKPETQYHPIILHNMYILIESKVVHHRCMSQTFKWHTKFLRKSPRNSTWKQCTSWTWNSKIFASLDFLFVLLMILPVYVFLRMFYGFVWFHDSSGIKYQDFFQSWLLLCSFLMFSNLYWKKLHNIKIKIRNSTKMHQQVSNRKRGLP